MEMINLSFEVLKRKVVARDNVSYDIEFARRVANSMRLESSFFFGDFSRPFLSIIANKIAHEKSYRDILGFYYDFVSEPIIESEQGVNIPHFKLLTGYIGQRGAHLYTYVMVCTWRKAIKYFDRKKPGSLVLGGNTSFDFEDTIQGLVESSEDKQYRDKQDADFGWEILNAFLYEDIGIDEEHQARIKKVKKAFNWLQEKDRKVLQYVVIEDKSGLETFELMKQYLQFKSDKIDVENWDDKKKQDRVSLWKIRAIERLEVIVKSPNLKI